MNEALKELTVYADENEMAIHKVIWKHGEIITIDIRRA